MNHWQQLDSASIPGSPSMMSLHQRGEELMISVDGNPLMSSRQHGSEDALAALALDRLANPQRARLLIGGLGMGFTLAAALERLGPDGQAVVAELVPAVIRWNQGVLGAVAGSPLDDGRARVQEADVVKLIRGSRRAWDAILLDVDNGPEGLTRQSNDRLYSPSGLAAARKALRPGGVLAIWSAWRDDAFTTRLKRTGYKVEVKTVRAHGKKGTRHVIWLAR
jgi:spermidine synthase